MISTRVATPDDARLFFDWRVDKLVVAQSFNTEPIEFSRHKKWFEAKIADPYASLYVFQLDGEDAGQARFDQVDNAAEISYSLAARFRGRRLATPLLDSAIKKFLHDSPHITKLIAKVKHDNAVSNRVFEKLAFTLLPSTDSEADSEANNTFQLTVERQ